MTTPTPVLSGAILRLALVGASAEALRLTLAARELRREGHLQIHTVALAAANELHARAVREADELVALPASADLEAIAHLLHELEIDAVWSSHEDERALALAHRCRQRGVVYLGAHPVALAKTGGPGEAALLDPAALAALGVHAPRGHGRRRRLELTVLADTEGQRIALPAAEVTLRRAGRTVLAECPAPGLPAEVAESLRLAALRLAHDLELFGVVSLEAWFEPATGAHALCAVRATPRADHALEAVVGLDLWRLRLHLARGGRLGEEDRQIVHGHAVTVRLTSEDPEIATSPGAGIVELCRPPLGPGLRLVPAVAEGDSPHTSDDPTLATLVAWAGGRGEALERLRSGLRETALLVRAGGSNKACLMALTDRAELRSLEFDDTWFDAFLARGTCLDDAHAATALLYVAIAAHQEARARQAVQFFHTGRRGRPRLGPAAGTRVTLRHHGASSELQVAQLSAESYRVTGAAGTCCDVRLEALGRHAARLTIGKRTHQVRAVGHGGHHAVEIDGFPRHVQVEDRLAVVRSPSPAVVLRLPVAAGDEVAAGAAVVVLESMKMEITVQAPEAGRVREVLVTPSAQVDLDAPLVIYERTDDGEPSASHELRLPPPPAPPEEPAGRLALAWAELRRLLLGYDADGQAVRTIAAQWKAACAAVAGDSPQLDEAERLALGIFADIQGLFRRLPTDPDEHSDDREFESSQEHLLTYLRTLAASRTDAGGPLEPRRTTAGPASGLPPSFVQQLARALRHYGVDEVTDGPALREALQRIFRASERADALALVVAAILDRRLGAARSATPGDALHAVLHRLVSTSRRRFPAVHELALELTHLLYDAPGFESARAQLYQHALEAVARLATSSSAEERAATVRELVDTPQPLISLLAWRMTHTEATEGQRAAMLEALTRRHYRTRALRDLTVHPLDGHHYVVARYPSGERMVTAIGTYARREALAEAVRRLTPVLTQAGPADEVVVDFTTTADGALPPEAEDEAAVRRALAAGGLPLGLCRVVVSTALPGGHPAPIHCVTYRRGPEGYVEDLLVRGVHPMVARRMSFWRLAGFALERLPSVEDVCLYRGVARDNPKDERLFAMAEVRDLTPVRDARGRIVQLPYLERMLGESLAALRRVQAVRPARDRLQWNRVILQLWQPLLLTAAELDEVVRRLAPATEGLGIEQVMVYARMPEPGDPSGALHERVLRISNTLDGSLDVRITVPPTHPLATLTEYEQKVISLRRRGLTYPYELVRLLTPATATSSSPRGEFLEHDLDADGALGPVTRPWGQSSANIVVGLVRNFTAEVPEGLERVVLLGDASKEMGSLAEPECRRIIAAIDLAERRGIPLEWFALSAGAKISRQSGTENMDWISAVLRRIIEHTQRGGEINIVVCGITVGAQPYWNAEATMLMHTRGILIMAADSAMVLTGKQALDYSGSTSAEDNQGIGGYERIMGPNGQAQYWAPNLAQACRILLAHYAHTYVVPGERFPRQAVTADARERDVRLSPHPDPELPTVGDVLGARNADRKRPFQIRAVMSAIADRDHEPLERWRDARDAEIGVIWDAHVGGHPVCMIGVEAHALVRRGYAPADGPVQWTSGTLFPRSSKKLARAINATSGNRPLVVVANLAGFDGSPESMRELQLEYGAEIGRAVVNFDGPIVFCVVSRYHGGAFVVFSKRLNPEMEVLAVEGARASVIGGAPAAAVVFARDVETRTAADPRLTALEAALATAPAAEKAALRSQLAALRPLVHAEKLGEVADEFDRIHSVERAQRMGSIDRIVPAAELRPSVIDALERGRARTMARWRAGIDGPRT